jgi:hypothetical protein
LLAARELLDVVGGEGEEVCDAWGDFVKEGLLGFAEGWFGEEFKVLNSTVSDLCREMSPLKTYSCRLKDFGHSRKIADARVED